jgi:predicted secreted protein
VSKAIKAVFAFVISLWLLSGYSQQSPVPPVHDVVHLSASASLEVPQDYLTLTMSTSRDGPDAQGVQEQLKQALESALSDARMSAKPEAMEVRTGHFSMSPRYGRDGHISGWRGSVSLLLLGNDLARISSTAGNIQGLTVSGAVFSLSREQRARVESQVQAMAIERFKAGAADIAKAFGFGGYSLREVSVSSNDQAYGYRPMAMAVDDRLSQPAKAAAAAVPVEAGMGVVQVNVSGSVQLK